MSEINIPEKIERALLSAARGYVRENFPDKEFPGDIHGCIQPTRESKHGDLSSNIAMRLASFLKSPPDRIGKGMIEAFRAALEASGLKEYVRTVELKGGFINLGLSDLYYRELLKDIHRQGPSFGQSSEGNGKKVNIEFVSANPTGPLTIAHGRQAAIGDALARILECNGYDVTREYYLNDVGNQINMLGKSLEVRYRELAGESAEMPEDGYMGEYIVEMAKELKKGGDEGDISESRLDGNFFRDYAVGRILEMIKKDLEDFGVRFDVWTEQSGIEARNEVETTLDELDKAGYIFDFEGARWFRSTGFGDDKDRVVVKSDGSFTYLAPDMAYHRDKYARGYEKIIDLLGPDHHGYIKRMKAAVQALGHDEKSLDILIVQLVTLMRGGIPVSMSTRKGEFVSLRELLDDIGPDVTRFFFLSRRLDSHLDIDVELAKKESSENPVYYMQYAHARIRSIQKFSEGMPKRALFVRTRLELLAEEGERQLMRKLNEFPFAVRSSAEALEPNRLLTYLNELARCFHSFYTTCRVVTDDLALSKARLFLVECARITLANGLGILNISLPERM